MEMYRVSKKPKLAEDEEAKTKSNIYLFYEVKKGNHSLYVRGIDSDSLSIKVVATKSRDGLSKMGYIAHGSKLYAIGGETMTDGHTGYSTDIFVRDVEGGSGDWEKGPQLISPKVEPAVVVVNDKLYALNGASAHKKDDKLFEVLDLNCATGVWTELPNPPFDSWYVAIGGPVIHRVTVVQNTIYVLAGKLTSYSDRMLFSFDVGNEKWTDHHVNVDPEAANNLVAKYLKNGWWETNDQLVEGIWYSPDADLFSLRMYAMDIKGVEKGEMALTSFDILPEKTDVDMTDVDILPEKTDRDMTGASNTPRYRLKDGQRLYWQEEHNPGSGCPPFHFLDIPFFIKPADAPGFSPFLIHLGDKRFILGCSYPREVPHPKQIEYICLLQLMDDEESTSDIKGPSSYAVVVKQKYTEMSHRLKKCNNWSKVMELRD